MDIAFNIIVIILSIFLAIFLFLGITILFFAFRLAKKAKQLEESLSQTAGEAKSFVRGFKSSVVPAVAAKMFSSYLKNRTKKSRVKVKK